MLADYESLPALCGLAPRVDAQRPVTPMHAALPGRARLRVAGLRRNPALGRDLIARLPGRPGIRAATVNLLSGTVLVQFAPGRDLGEIVAAVELVLRTSSGSGAAADDPVAQDDAQAWHAAPTDRVLAHFGTSPTAGLSAALVAAQGARHGANVLPPAAIRSTGALLLEQLASLPVVLLLGSAVVSLATGGVIDAALVLSVIAANATIGYATTRQTERLMRVLADAVLPAVEVLRDGQAGRVPATEVVPGDLLLLAPGTIVPADARVVEGAELGADESALTGESATAGKTDAPVAPGAPLAERASMIHRGSTIVAGRGRAVVTATGSGTEIGTIQSLAATTRPPATPLERQLDHLGRVLAIASLVACGAVFAIGRLRGHGVVAMLETSVALAVAAIPEGLPTVATVTLALGIRRMRAFNVLVRQLDAIETLGAVDVVCFDKTGTLTENAMSVRRIVAGGRRFDRAAPGFVPAGPCGTTAEATGLRRLLEVGMLCNDAIDSPDGNGPNGSATERALLWAAAGAGLDVQALRAACPLEGRVDRAPMRRYMRTTHRTQGGRRVAVKGSPAEVLALCAFHLADGKETHLLAADRVRIAAENEALAGDGLRVLGFAAGGADDPPDKLVWLGLAGLADPVRPGLRALMQTLHAAGVETVMITGDQSLTAYAIARELDLSAGRPIEILDGPAIEATPLDELAGLAARAQVFARVSPAHKLQIVQALQRAGKVVAMTGDGINDSPALRAADIGLAMGRGGTDAARQMADVVLADDNLATIAVAIREGRTIHRSIRRAVRYLISTNLSELALVGGSVALASGQPLRPAQLLWLNLVTDVAPALALGMEPAETEVLHAPPRAARAPLFAAEEAGRIGLEGALIGTSAFAAHRYGLARFGGPNGGGVSFLACILAQLLHGWSSRSPDRALLGADLPPNPALRRTLLGLGAAQVAAGLVPFTRRILGIGALDLPALGVIGLAGSAPFLLIEAMKTAWPAAARRRPQGGSP